MDNLNRIEYIYSLTFPSGSFCAFFGPGAIQFGLQVESQSKWVSGRRLQLELFETKLIAHSIEKKGSKKGSYHSLKIDGIAALKFSSNSRICIAISVW